MILHIGCDEFLPVSSIVAILSAPAREGLSPSHPPSVPARAQVQIVGEPVKSVIVAASGGRCVFFLSPISAQTLRRRCGRGTIN